MSQGSVVLQEQEEKRMKPIPTVIKERLGVTALRKQLGQKLKELEGREILAVTISGSDSKAIVREEYLYELINLCNSLLYDQIDQELSSAPDTAEKEQMIQDGKQVLKKIFESN